MGLRAVLVVALAAAAAVALSARDGLDWERLADPVEVRWARVLVGVVVGLLLAALARGVLRRLRRQARPPGAAGDERAEPDGEPFSVVLRMLAVVLVLATLAAAWWVIDGVAPEAPGPSIAPVAADATGPDPSLPTGPHWPTLLLVGAALVAVAVAARLRGGRADTQGEGGSRDEDDEGDDPAGHESSELAAAVAAGQVELSGHQDPRTAILAAYAAMSARIESGLASAGRSASPADTPTELLSRAAAAGLVDGSAASSTATLTALFREARFSRHPMGEAHRREAVAALAAVREELGARRV